MNTNNDVIETELSFKKKQEMRESYWKRFFKKYEADYEDEGVLIKDIVEVYSVANKGSSDTRNCRKEKGRRGRPRLMNNIELVTEKKCENIHSLEQGDARKSPGIPRKRGRPRLQKNVKSETKVHQIKVKDIIGNNAVCKTARKRGRPRLQKNLKSETEVHQIKVKDIIGNNAVAKTARKRGRPRLLNHMNRNTEGDGEHDEEMSNGEIELKITNRKVANKNLYERRGKLCTIKNVKVENDFENTIIKSEIRTPVTLGKRGRPRLKKNTKIENLTEELPEKDITTSNDVSSPTKRGRPRLDNSTHKQNISSSKYKWHVVHTFCNKEFQKEHPYLYQDEMKFPKSFNNLYTSNTNLETVSPRKKNCVCYRDVGLKKLYPYYYREDDKENQYLFRNNISEFNERVLNFDVNEDICNTKFIIEEKLKSNLRCMVLKRYQSKQLMCENKKNIYLMWHGAVKEELKKLNQTISLEKLEQYMSWCIETWIL